MGFERMTGRILVMCFTHNATPRRPYSNVEKTISTSKVDGYARKVLCLCRDNLPLERVIIFRRNYLKCMLTEDDIYGAGYTLMRSH